MAMAIFQFKFKLFFRNKRCQLVSLEVPAAGDLEILRLPAASARARVYLLPPTTNGSPEA